MGDSDKTVISSSGLTGDALKETGTTMSSEILSTNGSSTPSQSNIPKQEMASASGKTSSQFQCPVCDDSSVTIDTIWSHLYQKHNARTVEANKNRLCYFCGRRFERMADLNLHLKKHDYEAQQSHLQICCTVCGVKYNNEDEHLSTLASGRLTVESSVDCRICGVYIKHERFQKHLESHFKVAKQKVVEGNCETKELIPMSSVGNKQCNNLLDSGKPSIAVPMSSVGQLEVTGRPRPAVNASEVITIFQVQTDKSVTAKTTKITGDSLPEKQSGTAFCSTLQGNFNARPSPGGPPFTKVEGGYEYLLKVSDAVYNPMLNCLEWVLDTPDYPPKNK